MAIVQETRVRRGSPLPILAIASLVTQVLVAPALGAQQSEELQLQRLRPGQTLRLHLADGQRLESRIDSVTGSPFSIQLRSLPTPLTLEKIDYLRVKGRATAIGAVIGAAIGAVGSVVISAAYCEAIRRDFPCGESGETIAASIAGGAVLGAAIGYAVPKWRLRYSRNRVVGMRMTIGPQASLGLSMTFP